MVSGGEATMNRKHLAGTLCLIGGMLGFASFALDPGKGTLRFISAILFFGLAGFNFANAARQRKVSTDEELNRLQKRVTELNKKQARSSKQL
jgi:hypothetical protein